MNNLNDTLDIWDGEAEQLMPGEETLGSQFPTSEDWSWTLRASGQLTIAYLTLDKIQKQLIYSTHLDWTNSKLIEFACQLSQTRGVIHLFANQLRKMALPSGEPHRNWQTVLASRDVLYTKVLELRNAVEKVRTLID